MNLNKYLFLLGVLVVLTLSDLKPGYKVSDFKPGFFKLSHPPEGFQQVDTGTQIIGEILGFADMNGDHYTDYIAISDRAKKNLWIYFWKDDACNEQCMVSCICSQLNNFVQIVFREGGGSHGMQCDGYVGDLTKDGRNQMLVVYLNANKKYDLEIYTADQCKNYQCSYSLLKINYEEMKNMSAIPLITNNLGDQQPQILIFNGNKRYVMERQQNKYDRSNFDLYTNNLKSDYIFKTVDRHYGTIIDFSGDCQADLIIISTENNQQLIQFYIKQTNSKYYLDQIIPFNSGKILFMTFGDLDGNGAVDMLMVVQNNTTNKILIAYNQNYVDGLCNGPNTIPYNLNKLYQLQIDGTPIDNIHLGDVDSDGYVDILGIFRVNGFKKAYLLLNQGDGNKRVFKESTHSHRIAQLINPQQVAFFDLGEDGKLDILVMTNQSFEQNGVAVGKITRKAIYNNLKEDTLFIKILPLSPSSSYDTSSIDISSAFGVTIQWMITNLDGSKTVQTLNQKSQWSYGSLQLPFSVGGLGRTNNYLEDLTVGYQGTGNKQSWSPIIPNSQLMVYKQNTQWKLQTLLTNIDRIYSVIYVSIVILILLGLVVLFLNHRQSKQDQKDHYNFIQMIR